ncbi:Uncharacterized protein BP5553_02646 [Venustampulla echinocandica]|uniref:Glycoprotease family protein n=1 Tax=Venustampulla echinocandica TaxID=2656787 RepID=A0A370TRZ6_9HELO|nr:Uncharacterized protein BP5553_02646 [Venustampulla echinocandica]RDL38306.1 Uncharacterized protein BP5553_02646 [Venustampulla echinocandica]
MFTTTGTAAKPDPSKNDPSTGSGANPFDSPFDGDDDAYGWWDEEEAPGRGTSKADKAPRVTQWPKLREGTGAGYSTKTLNRNGTRKSDRRYSVSKPHRLKSRARQKKQNANAGITLVTDFSSRQKPIPPPVQLQPVRSAPENGCFVDLAALQALNGESTQASGGFWRFVKTKADARAPNAAPAVPGNAPNITTSGPSQGVPKTAIPSRRRASTLLNTPIDPRADLSPSDRPIVIGLSIPSSDVSVHTLSPQTASSETSKIIRSYERRVPSSQPPETPTIVITPAQEGSSWSPFDQGTTYSSQNHPSTDGALNSKNVPPVPKVPVYVLREEQQRLAAQKSYFSPDSDDGTVWEDVYPSSGSSSRVVSSGTIFEEDISPILARTARAVSVSGGRSAGKHASISTVGTSRRSGWWNYITTPFLTRSNTFATREVENQQPPVLPSLAIAAAKIQDADRADKSWEKQFSPLTPATSTTIQSDSWWDVESKDSKPVTHSPVHSDTRHKVQASTATVPFILSERILSEDPPHNVVDSTSRGAHSTSTESAHSNSRVAASLDDSNMSGLQSNNQYSQPQREDLHHASNTTLSTRRQPEEPAPVAVVQPPQPTFTHTQRSQSPSEVPPPPPYSPSPPRIPRYRAVFPPGHALNIEHPASPGPVTPGMQQAMASSGAIPMANVPLTPPARGPINLNSSYAELPPRQNGVYFAPPPLQPVSSKARKAEAKRRRQEKEDALAHKAGGLYRGRGCIPKEGCYGRKGAEGRKRRRWYLGLGIGLLLMIILIVTLALTLHRKPNSSVQPSQWLNLTGFPPIFVGLSTIVAPENIVSNTGCVFPATQWSCKLPKELQASVKPKQPSQPNFLLQIQWDNSSSANTTFANVTGNPNLVTRAAGGSAVSAGQFIKHLVLRAKQAVTFAPSPQPPSFADEFFLGNTTDGVVSDQKAGEPTPFYITLLSTDLSNHTKRGLPEQHQLMARDSDPFPDVSSIIPAPSLSSDGTAAPANLLPLPTQQPIRLYDRGLPSERYSFYTYFDRSIFLKSLDPLNSTNSESGAVPDDENGGAPENAAGFRCTWAQTRFMVQIWTRMNTTAQLLNRTRSASEDPAADFEQPGSFPYPVTITTDRHGGDPARKMLYCYSLDSRERPISTSGKIMAENRSFGGVPINPAALLFSNSSDPSLGGFDGGAGGCSCQWSNFQGLA